MRAKFICRSVGPDNGIKKTHLVFDPSPTGLPTDMWINGPDVICEQGDTCLVQITVIKRMNGERKIRSDVS